MARFDGTKITMTAAEVERIPKFHPGRYTHGYLYLRDNRLPHLPFLLCQHVYRHLDGTYSTRRTPVRIAPSPEVKP